MKTSFAAIFFVASLASFAQAADVMVNVGNAKGENVFEPAKVMAMPGDNVVFTWVSGKHTDCLSFL
jgi:plastocyanin